MLKENVNNLKYVGVEIANTIFNQRHIETLAMSGLSVTQARLYLALIYLGCPTVRELTIFSKIGRGDIYRALSSLEQLSLVSKVIATPNRFKPLPLQKGVNVLLQRKIDEDLETRSRIKELVNIASRFRKSHQELEYESNVAWIPPKQVPIKAAEMVAAAKVECKGIFSWKNLCRITCYPHGAVYARCRKEGLKARIITEKKPADAVVPREVEHFKSLPSVQVRYQRGLVEVDIFMSDSYQVFLTTKPVSLVRDNPNIWTNNPCLMKVIDELFERKWTEAKPE